jgi:hypothetical protein
VAATLPTALHRHVVAKPAVRASIQRRAHAPRHPPQLGPRRHYLASLCDLSHLRTLSIFSCFGHRRATACVVHVVVVLARADHALVQPRHPRSPLQAFHVVGVVSPWVVPAPPPSPLFVTATTRSFTVAAFPAGSTVFMVESVAVAAFPAGSAATASPG